MYYDYDEELMRKNLKRRYNRRFMAAAHLFITLTVFAVALFMPVLLGVAMLLFLTFIPHAIYALYFEYQYWLERKIDHAVTKASTVPYEKQKRSWPGDHPQPENTSFQLTDDGEIEEVYTPDTASWPNRNSDYNRESYKPHKGYKRSKKYKKYDTDKFDVKKMLKKLIDIVD